MSENLAITLALSHVPCEKKQYGRQGRPSRPSTSREASGCGSLPSEPPHHRAGKVSGELEKHHLKNAKSTIFLESQQIEALPSGKLT